MFSEFPVLYTTADLPCFVLKTAYQRGSISAYLSLPWPSASILDALPPSLILGLVVRSVPSSLRHMSDAFALVVGDARSRAYRMSFTRSTTAESKIHILLAIVARWSSIMQ